jgi:CheY-like chemotaxis protein
MALTVFRAHHDTIALVLLDAVMPRLSGQDAYRQLKDEYPDVRVIFCSGYAPETAHSNFIVQEHLRLVEKPYNPTVLLSTIREVLDAEELCPTT